MRADQVFLWLTFIGLGILLDYAMLRWGQRLWSQGQTLTGQVARFWQALMPSISFSLPRRARPRLARAKSAQVTAAPGASAAADSSPTAPEPVTRAPSPDTAAEGKAEPAQADTSSNVVVVSETTHVVPTPAPAAETVPRVAHVQIAVDLPEGTAVRLTVESFPGTGVSVTQHGQPGTAWPRPQLRPPLLGPGLRARLQGAGRAVNSAWVRVQKVSRALVDRADVTLFVVASVVYLLTRFIGLEQFPIYFFGDEAVQTVSAADLVRNGFRDPAGNLLPTYFQNATFFNLGTSVYLQVIPLVLFGKSVLVTRGVSAVVSLFGAVGVSLTLKNIFNVRWWWAGGLVLAATPAWFLYTRTAFENATLASFYAWFLYGYLMYRHRDPRYLFLALLCGALAFYSYSGSALVIVITGLFFLISDLRYHWAQRRIGWWGLAFLGLLVVPYIRFQLQHPGATYSHLRILDSPLFLPNLTLPQRVGAFFKEYAYGLSIDYWFAPENGRDLNRHRLMGYGQLMLATLPLIALGIYVCVRQIKSATHRVVLLSLLAAPTGGAMVAIALGRVLVTLIPATLLSVLGLEALRQWTPRRFVAWLGAGAFVLFSGFSFYMLGDALLNGPTWYTDYGLYGMQYGAVPVYGEIKDYLRRSPDTQVKLSPVWANGADYVMRFFTSDDPRVSLDSIQGYLYEKRDLPANTLFVMPPEEYDQVVTSPKFADIRVEKTLPWPDGRPGFYFVRLRYSDMADQIFAEEEAARRRPVEETAVINGETVQVLHSRFDGGSLPDLFDGDTFTLVRTQAANPVLLELTFPTPHRFTGVTLTTGSFDIDLIVRLYADEDAEPVVYQQSYFGLPPDPTVELTFENPPDQVMKVRFEIRSINDAETAKVHVREVTLH